MKNCPVCQAVLDDNATFCPNCGNAVPAVAAPVAEAAPQQPVYQEQPYQQPYQQPVYQQPYPQPAPVVNPYDHTAEFDAQDISDHKVYCMLVYLLGTIGIIIALLAGKDSAYVKFHVRQAIKLQVTQILLMIITALLFWTIIVGIAGAVCMGIVSVLQIICFFQICGGKAKEPAIIRSLKFLK